MIAGFGNSGTPATVHVRHCVTGMRVGCLVIIVAHVVHLKPISAGAFILRRKVRVLQHRAGKGTRSSPQPSVVLPLIEANELFYGGPPLARRKVAAPADLTFE